MTGTPPSQTPSVVKTVGKGKTVLLVDDEADIRMTVGQILRRNGFEVISASGGLQALQISKEHKGTIHLLLTDLLMPGMNGIELVKNLIALRPQILVVYMSDSRVIHEAFSTETKLAFVEKPFSSEVLLNKINQVLNPSSQPLPKNQPTTK